MGKIYEENSVPSIKVTFYILKDQIQLKPNFGLLLQIRNKIVKVLERIFELLLHSRNIMCLEFIMCLQVQACMVTSLAKSDTINANSNTDSYILI